MNIEEYLQWLNSLKVGDKVSSQWEKLVVSCPSKRYVYNPAWVLEVSDFIYVRVWSQPPKFSMEYWTGDMAQHFCRQTGKSMSMSDEVIGYYKIVPFQETNGEEFKHLGESIYPLS